MPEHKAARPVSKSRKAWRKARPFVVVLISLGITFGIVAFTFQYLMSHFIYPVDINDPTPITVVVEKNDSASSIANKLYQACGTGAPGLISNKAVFKVYVDFVGKANQLKAGTYILSKNMDIPQMVDIICAGNPPKQTVKFTVQEGYTISGVIWSLGQAGLAIDEKEFQALCNDKELFGKFDFISQIPEDTKRDYLLEGYLFPDTYEAYFDANGETIINRMLQRFNDIFTLEYVARAEELGMTVDEVVTLASIIEREAAVQGDFAKVSAVFHNRLKAGQKLESCATLQYVLKQNKYVFNAEEMATDSHYNTYLYNGLPAGPISNPGKLAIEAALWPNEEFLEEDYRYFCNMEVSEENLNLAFAKTYEEHQRNIEKYQQYWD